MNYRIVFPHSLLPQNGFHAPMPCIFPFSSVIFTEPYQLFICIFIKEQVVCTLVLDIKEEGESFGTGPSGSPFLWVQWYPSVQPTGMASTISASSDRRDSNSSAIAPFCGIRAGKSVFPGLYISVAIL